MADEALVAGLEKVQVDETQQTGNLKASKEKSSVVPEKLQYDSSDSDSESDKEKPAFLVKGASQKGKKKKRPIEKEVIKKNKGDPSTTDKLQCDSSSSESSESSGDENSKSESGHDGSNSKSGSGDNSKSSKSASRDDSKYKSGSVLFQTIQALLQFAQGIYKLIVALRYKAQGITTAKKEKREKWRGESDCN